MLPFLKFLADKKEKSNQEIHDGLADLFNLSQEEVNQLLPSGTQKIFYNRVAWAKTYLSNAGLITSPKRGYSEITERGLEVLKSNPDKIDIRYLKQFPEFIKFKFGSVTMTAPEPTEAIPEIKTPEELIDDGFQSIIDKLSKDLLQKIKECPPAFFEKLVIDLLLAMGYGGSRQEAGKVVGKSGDGGIDGIINEDKLGLDSIYIQAKRWEGSVSRPEIQKFAGALLGKAAKREFLSQPPLLLKKRRNTSPL
jgi:restriction system protein